MVNGRAVLLYVGYAFEVTVQEKSTRGWLGYITIGVIPVFLPPQWAAEDISVRAAN